MAMLKSDDGDLGYHMAVFQNLRLLFVGVLMIRALLLRPKNSHMSDGVCYCQPPSLHSNHYPKRAYLHSQSTRNLFASIHTRMGLGCPLRTIAVLKKLEQHFLKQRQNYHRLRNHLLCRFLFVRTYMGPLQQ